MGKEESNLVKQPENQFSEENRLKFLLDNNA